MNLYDKVLIERAERVDEFHDTYRGDFPAGTVGDRMFGIIHDALARCRDHATQQTSGHNAAMEGTTSKREAIDHLREQMDAIARTARALALVDSGLDDKFQMPSGRSEHDLLSAAGAFLIDAKPLEKDFLGHDLPATFLADLQAAIDAVDAAGRGQGTGKETHIAARSSLDTALDEIGVAIRHLDAIVPNRLGNSRDKIAVWKSARRVERVARAKADPASQPTPEAAKAVASGA
jgi:hypothetical protein